MVDSVVRPDPLVAPRSEHDESYILRVLCELPSCLRAGVGGKAIRILGD